MKKNLFLWQFACFVSTVLFGTLLHFMYNWSNENAVVALIAAVNESTWEHMKLLYFPMLIFAFIQYRHFKDVNAYWWIKLTGILTGLISIPVLFYTYNGAIGKSPDWLNISFFFTPAAIACLTEYFCIKNSKLKLKGQILPFILILFISTLFIFFTFNPPDLPIFRDPVTGTWGLK